MRTTPENIQSLEPNEIFVFGSNGEGRHDGGAARIAMEKFGAIYGQSFGLQGQSFGINTMDGIQRMKFHVDVFIEIVKRDTDLIFLVTPLGCGIAGYTTGQVAPLFKDAIGLTNIALPESFKQILKIK